MPLALASAVLIEGLCGDVKSVVKFDRRFDQQVLDFAASLDQWFFLLGFLIPCHAREGRGLHSILAEQEAARRL